MPAVQATFQERPNKWVEGQIADGQPYRADTYIASANDQQFGRALKRAAANSEKVVMGVDGNAAHEATNFVGVSIRDITRGPDEGDEYDAGASVAALTEGDIIIKVDGAVNMGDAVTANTGTGRLGSKDPAAAQITIPGAVWMTNAADNGLARLRLTGALGAAA